MSTLRTNTLQTLDSAFSIDVEDIASQAQVGAVVGSVQNVVANITALKALLKTGNPFAQLAGHTTAGDGGGGEFWLDLSDTTSAEIAGVLIVATDGGRWKRTDTSKVKTSWFGAKGDRTADDTVAVQAAINYCNSFTIPKPLVIVGSSLITASLNIDRPVEATNGDFRISGEGVGSGIFVNTAITMFSSTLPFGVNPGPTYSLDPCTEYTQFEGVEFVSSNAALAAYVFDAKYLRLTFTGCSFRRIKAIGAAQYIQSIKFLNCRMRQHTGSFLLVTDIYNLIANDNEFEISGPGFAWTGVARGAVFDGNLYEGSSSPFISGTGAAGLTVSNNYFEANGAPDIVLGNSGGASNGVVIDGNLFLLSPAQFADPSHYPVILGIGTGINCNGNLSTGNIFNNNAVLPFGLGVGTNSAGTSRVVFSTNPFSVSSLVAHAGGGQALATPVTRLVTIFTTTATAGDSALMPAVGVMEAWSQITVMNKGAASMSLYPATGERFSGLATNSPVSVATNTTIRLAREAGDAWQVL